MPNQHLIASIWKTDRFATRIARHLGQKKRISEVMLARDYTNAEFNPTFRPIDKRDLSKGYTSTGNHIYLVGCFNPRFTPQEIKARVELAAKAAKDTGALSVTAILPDIPYTRADRSSTEDPIKMGGKAFSLEALAEGFSWHVDRVLTIHPHSKRIYDIFGSVYSKLKGHEVKGEEIVYALDPSPVVAHYFLDQGFIDSGVNGGNAVFLVPDEGAREINDRVYDYVGLSGLRRVYCSKTREKANDPDYVFVTLGEPTDIFKGMVVIFIDDGVDTGGTFDNTFALVPEAKKRIVYITHPWLKGNYPNDDAQDILLNSNIDLIVFGDTHPDRKDTLNDELLNSKIIFIDYTRYLADAIEYCFKRGKKLAEHYSFGDKDEFDRKVSQLYNVIDPKRI